jgi:hypothetical protein
VVGTFTLQEGNLSSAARETIGNVRSICIASRIYSRQIRDSSVLILGDSQAALGALRKLASPVPFIHQELKTLFYTCSSGAFDVVPRWIPRERLTEADELSRRPDASDWGCTPELIHLILQHFRVTIDLDVYASDIHHVSERFISAFYVPGCAAVQASAHDWKQFLPHPSGTIWAFPPTKFLSEVLSNIESQRVNAIVIMPTKTSSNDWIQVQAIEAAVSSPFHLPRQASLCQASLRVPAAAINHIVMGLTAFFISWNV